MEKLCLEIETAASKSTLDEWSKKNETKPLKNPLSRNIIV